MTMFIMYEFEPDSSLHSTLTDADNHAKEWCGTNDRGKPNMLKKERFANIRKIEIDTDCYA